VRGPSRSVPEDLVAEEFRALCGAGYREIVLTGINTGEYGKDLRPGRSLVSLLERLLGEPGDARIRLNSVEPRAVTGDLCALLRSEGRLARHLQIPLQSGSDAVLAAMKRNYRADFYRDLVGRVAEEVPDIGLGADVLVGFPSESTEDFRATERLLEDLPLAFLHAFTYSPRPGTAAASMKPLPASVTGPRTAALRRLGAEKTRAFASRFVDRPLPAVTLAPRGEAGRALTDNFLDLTLEEKLPPNRFVEVRVTDADSMKAVVSR
jgi:threonylcarbamoyladenosine tRNA methylthiotransferase MtaB